MILLGYLFWCLAAALNALMDTLETKISFQASKLRKLDINKWCKAVTANNRGFLPYTKYRVDPWHLAKSGMIVLQAASIVVFSYNSPLWFFGLREWWAMPLDCLILMLTLGILWNGTFNLFFNRVFK